MQNAGLGGCTSVYKILQIITTANPDLVSLFAFLALLCFTYFECKASFLSQHGSIGWEDMFIVVFESPFLRISFKCLIQQQPHVLYCC